ncbi:MAG: DoxX family protein [Castellaniella sp.]|uniref:DoxX family protein n=1 Tax=Castellaniella sp. TaxID=1955812 RepID=UPI001223544B|nr:DoxX family protein [Castellaniella sp.]TAN29988.1 MAG: DoxX family protein [Castellaniella sp.]
MSSSSLDDLGKLVLRLGLGALLLLHGISKLHGGVDWITGMVAARGLPGFVAYGVYIGEIVAPILIILGIYARIGGLIVAINMLFALGLAHMKDLFVLGKSGGWALELQGLYLVSGLVILLIGAGRYSLSGRSGRFN